MLNIFLFQSLITKLDTKENDLKLFNKSSDQAHTLLLQYGGNLEGIFRRQTVTNEQFRKLRARLTDRYAEIEEITERTKRFDTILKSTHRYIFTTQKKVQPKFGKPVPKEEKKVMAEIDEIDYLLNELLAKKAELQETTDVGDWLMERGKRETQVVHEVQSRLNEVHRPVDELIKQVTEYKVQLQNSLAQHQALKEKVEDFDENLRNVEDKTTYLKPVSAKFAVARGQQEQFKVSERLYEINFRDVKGGNFCVLEF